MSHEAVRTITKGLSVLALGLIIQQVLPVWGWINFQMAESGTYNPENYQIDLRSIIFIAGIIIALGLAEQIGSMISAGGQQETIH